MRNVRLRTLAAEEFHASILAILGAARRFHTRAFVHLGDFQTAPTKLRWRGRFPWSKVRNLIALRTLENVCLLLRLKQRPGSVR